MGTNVRAERILRFRVAERLLHWAIAVPFLICFATALVLVFYYNPLPARPHRALFSWAHRISGVCLIGLPPLVLLAGIRDVRTHWENIKEGWIWSLSDVKWLLLMPFSMLSRRVQLPEEGKFNAGEKLNFMWTMASWPLYGLTGALIWIGDDLTRWVGVSPRLGVLPWIVHFSLAAMSTLLVSGHLFMAVINPASRVGLPGMFGGYVSRHWASHHYRRWFRERFATVVEVVSPAHDSGPVPVAQEPDTNVDARPWALPELTPELSSASVQAAPMAPAPELSVAPAPARQGRPHEPGEMRLLEIMRTSAHSAAVSTIDHMKTGAHVVVRTGVALTPATGALIVIFILALGGGGVLAARVAGRTYLHLGEEAALQVDPSARSLALSGGRLPRGARVARLGVAGRYSRVTDEGGRTGYVLTAALRGERPHLAAAPLTGGWTMAPATSPATAPVTAPSRPPGSSPVALSGASAPRPPPTPTVAAEDPAPKIARPAKKHRAKAHRRGSRRAARLQRERSPDRGGSGRSGE